MYYAVRISVNVKKKLSGSERRNTGPQLMRPHTLLERRLGHR